VPGAFLLPLRGAIKNYSWGSRTFLARLRGDAVPSPEPEAELWMGAHPGGPARVWSEGQERSLLELIERDPADFLGASSVERFGVEAPFLLKILAIDQPLSLQAHPDRAQAAAGFDRERAAGIGLDEGSYRDRRHKPELIVALEPLWLLRGLLEPAEIQRRFAEAGIASLAGETDRLARRGPAGLRDFLAAWLGVAGAARDRLLDESHRAADAARRARLSRDDPGYWVARMSELHPEDPTALAPLAMHLLRLAPGQGSFQPSRILHSYLDGAGVEVMANSDNVVRAGLTSKPVDLDELLAVVEPAPTVALPMAPTAEAQGTARYESTAEEFELWRLEARPGSGATMEGRDAPAIGICTRGSGSIAAPGRGERLDLGSGTAFAARTGAGPLELLGDLDVFVASIAME
jgi:mannose-6-phosphate isomerase